MSNTAAMTETVQAPRPVRSRTVLLSVLAVPVGALVSWLALLGALYVPIDNPLVWLGVPLSVVAALAWLATRRSRWVGASLAVAGVLTLVFFVWLFSQFGQGMEGFD